MSILEHSHNVVDIIHGVIPYNGLEMIIIDNPLFARLHRVYQSSLVYMTYPSNKVHRYEHSLGVMHLSGMFFYSAIRNSDPEVIEKLFKSVVTTYISNEHDWLLKYDSNAITDLEQASKEKQSSISDIFDYLFTDFSMLIRSEKDNTSVCKPEAPDTLYNSTLFRDNTPSNIERNRLYYILFEAVRLVGLLHDIGHLPYSHVAEYALTALNNEKFEDEKVNTTKLDDFKSTMKKYNCGSKTTAMHELVGLNLVKNIFTNLHKRFCGNNVEENFFVTSVFNMTWFILTSDTGIFLDLHKIVDSYIDCDRMDYTCRDLYCAGVSKEFPRYERIFNTVKIHFQNLPAIENEELLNSSIEREKCYFAFNSKAIGQIEFLLQRRWEDNANLNYHHSVHKHELLLKLVVVELGKKYLTNDKNPDINRNQLPDSINGIWLAMSKALGRGNVDKLFSQLDDEWLNTLIRKYFFTNYGNYYTSETTYHNDVLWNRLDELVTGRKHYSPLFKRRGGFARFDEVFVNAVLNSKNDVLLRYSQSVAENPLFRVILNDISEKKYKDISDSDYENVETLLELWFKSEELKKRPFFSALLKDVINKDYNFSSDKFYDRVNLRIKEWVATDEAKSMNIVDCLLDSNYFSMGIKATERENDVLLLSTEKDKPPKLLTEQSLIVETLENYKKCFPPFHIFYLSTYDTEKSQYVSVNKTQLSEKIAKIMVDTIIEIITEAQTN